MNTTPLHLLQVSLNMGKGKLPLNKWDWHYLFEKLLKYFFCKLKSNVFPFSRSRSMYVGTDRRIADHFGRPIYLECKKTSQCTLAYVNCNSCSVLLWVFNEKQVRCIFAFCFRAEHMCCSCLCIFFGNGGRRPARLGRSLCVSGAGVTALTVLVMDGMCSDWGNMTISVLRLRLLYL